MKESGFELIVKKPKISMYWASSCGGCEIALVNLHEKILDVAANFDFVFCPCLLDTKKKDLEDMPDRAIAITFFNGAIRTGENEEMARLLRRKSQTLVAFGSCSHEGCIPGLANLSSRQDILKTVYIECPSTHNPRGITPQTETQTPEGKLSIPDFYSRVKPLRDAVEVDYFMPGCPPEPVRVWEVMESIISGKPLPPNGSVIGAGNSSVCEECKRTKEDKKINRFYRTYEIIPDKEKCLLEQGLICMGIATRSGCGALCPMVNMPCTGCYGTPEGVLDQGAKMVASLGSILDIEGLKGFSEGQIEGLVEGAIASIPDPAGTFYKYSLPSSILRGRLK